MLSQAFLRLLVYRAGSTLSYQILAVTAGWHIYSITHDVLSLGLLGLAEVLPYFCSSLFAGHAVDVLSKRRLALAGCAFHLLIALVMMTVVALIPRRTRYLCGFMRWSDWPVSHARC